MAIYSEKISEEYPLFVYSLNPLNNVEVLEKIGNKARNLFRLYQLGYTIPPSIFADFSFFEAYKEKTDIVTRLVDKIVADLPANRFALRSSSNIEDSRSGSFAGLFKTTLDVDNNPAALTRAIVEWFQDHPSPRFIELVKHKKIDPEKFRLGLMIQKMIAPKISGVLFTCPPMNPTSEYFQIEYCQGAGDKLMSGEITGNLLNLDRSTGKADLKRGKKLFSRRPIQSLFHTATTLELKLGFPQDIEFVISKDAQLFLLQSRPITAFSYSPEFIIEKEKKKLKTIFKDSFESYAQYPVLSDSNITELYPNAIPLGYSIFKAIFAGTFDKEGGINLGRSRLGYAKIDGYERENLFISVGSQARVNLFIDALTFRLEGIDKKFYVNTVVRKYMDLIRENPKLANYPEYSLYIQSNNKRDWIEAFGGDGQELHRIHALYLERLRLKMIPETLAGIADILRDNDTHYRKELLIVSQKLELAALNQKMCEYVEYLRLTLAPEYVIIARIAFLSAYLVKSMLKNCFNNAEDNSPNLDKVNKYFDLLLFAYDSCPRDFKMPNQAEFEERVRSGTLSLNEFLDTFQHLGPLEISQPRLGEYSKDFLENFLKHKKEPSPKRLSGTPKRTLVKELLQDYKKHAPHALQEFKQWVDYANIFMNLREKVKFEILKIVFLVKRIVNQIAKLTDLNSTIYYLELDELMPNFHRLETLRLKALQKKAYSDASSKLVISKVIKNVDEQNILKDAVDHAGPEREYKSVTGTTIHYGKADGIALVAKTNNEYYEKLMEYHKRGITKIIGFFRGTELSYFNLGGLNGIVTESGGFLAHAATTAREYDIPYISNVNVDHFQDGYFVILDTDNQQVVYKERP